MPTTARDEKIAAYVCATAIVISALLVDGDTAITLAIAVAAALAGIGSYAGGYVRGLSKK